MPHSKAVRRHALCLCFPPLPASPKPVPARGAPHESHGAMRKPRFDQAPPSPQPPRPCNHVQIAALLFALHCLHFLCHRAARTRVGMPRARQMHPQGKRGGPHSSLRTPIPPAHFLRACCCSFVTAGMALQIANFRVDVADGEGLTFPCVTMLNRRGGGAPAPTAAGGRLLP